MCEFPCKQDENHLTTGDALPSSHIPHTWASLSTLSARTLLFLNSLNSSALFTSFLRTRCLVIFLISALFSPKSMVLTPQLAMSSSLSSTQVWCLVAMLCFRCSRLMGSLGRTWVVLPCFQSMLLIHVPTDFLELEYQSFCRCAIGLLYKLCFVVVCTAVLTWHVFLFVFGH